MKSLGCHQLFVLVLGAGISKVPIHAAVPCESDVECQQRFNSTLIVCLQDTNTCSNVYQRGCLHTKLGTDYSMRTCHSDDGTGNSDVCQRSLFDYPEVRIHQATWDTAFFMAWIYQVLLMELLEVPATVGLTTDTTAAADFYAASPEMPFSGVPYPYNALVMGNQVAQTCAVTQKPCAHVFPEVLPGQRSEYSSLVDDETIEMDSTNGLLGKFGLHVPSYTLDQHPQVASWYGLRGEENREVLASIFRRPTSWLDYCNEVSPTNCTSDGDEGAALRFPEPDEQDIYFQEASYQGHFRLTDQNNCTLFPDTCTGHVVAAPCTWSSHLDQQLYWNGIVGLESNGPLEPNDSYSYDQMIQVWRAANATQNHVASVWFQQDALSVEFAGTDFAFQYVIFPAPTRECVANWATQEQKCSVNFLDRVGNETGACGDDVQATRHLMVSRLQEYNFEASDADQSPAYEFLNNIKISNLDISDIMQRWLELGEDPSGNDAREAVCEWLVENYDTLASFVPADFPRTVVQRSQYDVWYLIVARIFGAIIGVIGLVAFCCCWSYRETKVMVFAQPLFMELILVGFVMICAGSILHAMQPNEARCVGSVWLLMMGYTIELVPVLVKTAAINSLIRSSKKQKRVNISRRLMIFKVTTVIAFVLAFLVSWTIIDPPKDVEVRTVDPNDRDIVDIDIKCASEGDVWRLVAFGWQAILLIIAAVLAFQSRDVMQQLNESKSLAVMVYSHFLFVCLRLVSFIFVLTDALPASATAALFSYAYSLDALFAMCIYVLPKILKAIKDPEDYLASRIANRMSSRGSGAMDSSTPPSQFSMLSDDGNMRAMSSDKLKILVCTANMGNAEPSMESLEAWIPPGGSCSRVTPLDDSQSLATGTFDLIVLGMQEATWKEKSNYSSRRGEVLSEEEILNAMEEKNTAQLRGMVQDVLGDSYTQLLGEQRGQMRMLIWGSDRVVDAFTDIKISGANTGIGNVLANKGGIVASLKYKKTRISFLSAHLAAHEGETYFKARCDNIRSILKEAKTSGLSKKLDVATSSHHMFVLGDLNFRTNFGEETQHEEDVQRALEMIQAGDYPGLYSFDELQNALSKRELLVDFKTLPCNFPPTFKVLREGGFQYKEQRTPSYTDRILFKSADGLSENIMPLAYEPCVNFITSDHKPVRGAFTITPNSSMGATKVDGDYFIDFEEMKGFNLLAGDSDGKSDPYLMFLWDSPFLTVETNTIFEKLRKLWMGNSWPRTDYISKTLDPDWKEQRMSLSLSDCSVGSDQTLYVAVIDYDAVGKDTSLGILTLNLKDLITMNEGQSEKIVSVDRPLQWEARDAGRIQFKVRISRQLDQKVQRRSSVLARLMPSSRELFGKQTHQNDPLKNQVNGGETKIEDEKDSFVLNPE